MKTEAADESDSSSYPSEALFEFLVAEVAAQRGDVEGALAVYSRLARELHDPSIARRAVETAIRARAFGPALESATLLLELDPDSALAREIMSALLANEGDLAKARVRVAEILAKSPQARPAARAALAPPGQVQRQGGGSRGHPLARENPTTRWPKRTTPSASRRSSPPRSTSRSWKSDKALARRPSWETAAILKAQVLRKASPDEIIAFYQQFVDANPDAAEVRMQLGRELAADRKLAEARDAFREAEKRMKGDPQPAYAIGLLSLQLEDFAEAQVSFTRALKGGYREPAAVYLGLGQGRRGPEAFRRGDRLVQEGRLERLGARAAQDRHPHLARAGTRRGPRIPAAHRAAFGGRSHPGDPGRGAAAARGARRGRKTYEMLTRAVEEFPSRSSFATTARWPPSASTRSTCSRRTCAG
jgi:tetratricopeptide (TPR) repeat protein